MVKFSIHLNRHVFVMGLRSTIRNVRDHMLTIANFLFSCDSFWRMIASIRELNLVSYGPTKMAANANKTYVCMFVTKNMGTFTALISFIRSIRK